MHKGEAQMLHRYKQRSLKKLTCNLESKPTQRKQTHTSNTHTLKKWVGRVGVLMGMRGRVFGRDEGKT
jgi:hypothetical protein